MPISSRLEALAKLVQRGGRIAQELRSQGIGRELKPDETIVTDADRAVEEYLRPELTAFAAGSTVWGEEFGWAAEGSGGLWVVDPIDGTSNFSFGSPLWGVTVALIEGESISLGAIYLPDLNELYLAESGQGSYRNREALPMIPPGKIRPEELVSYSDGLIRKAGEIRLPGKMRCAGAFVIDGSFTACQRYRGMIGHKERLYDIGASVLLCQELGADVRYADGTPFEIEPLKQLGQVPKPWIMFPRDSDFFLEA